MLLRFSHNTRMERAMRKTLVLVALLVAGHANAGLAFFTGRQEMVQTVTFKMVWKCQYNYNGRLFWQLFEDMCPSSVDVM